MKNKLLQSNKQTNINNSIPIVFIIENQFYIILAIIVIWHKNSFTVCSNFTGLVIEMSIWSILFIKFD